MSEYSTKIKIAKGDTAKMSDGGSIYCFPRHSTAVTYWSYRPERQELVVEYKSSKTMYIYGEVPIKALLGLLATESIGHFIATEIKPNHPLLRTVEQ